MKTLNMITMRPTTRRPVMKGSYFPTILDELFNDMEWPAISKTAVPSVNVIESASSYILEIAAPGFSKEAFNVEVENDTLIISADAKSEDIQEGEKYTRKEFSFQSFKRSFRLPDNQVDVEQIEGKYEHGILRIVLPKMAEEEQKANKRVLIG